MRIPDADPLERGYEPVEFRDVGNRADAYSKELSTGEIVLADEYFVVAAAAEFRGESLRVRGIGEGAGLYIESPVGRRDRNRRRCSRGRGAGQAH